MLAAHFSTNCQPDIDITDSRNSQTATATAMSQERDRLGLLGVGDHDAECGGALSGLQRLGTARYNKVSGSIYSEVEVRIVYPSSQAQCLCGAQSR